MKKFLLATLLVSAATLARAQWFGPYSVSSVEVWAQGLYFLKPTGLAAYPNPFNCTNTDWIFIDGSTPLANRALAIGLAAQNSGRKVRFYVTGCLNGGYIQASAITADPT
jgi:hypothetical protein